MNKRLTTGGFLRKSFTAMNDLCIGPFGELLANDQRRIGKSLGTLIEYIFYGLIRTCGSGLFLFLEYHKRTRVRKFGFITFVLQIAEIDRKSVPISMLWRHTSRKGARLLNFVLIIW
jgi:hypothetical protein